MVAWPKPLKPPWMDAASDAALPDAWRVRALRVTRRGFRPRIVVVVTTVLDAVGCSTQDVAALSRERWHCARDLRSLQVAPGMDVLRCKTPEMVPKELWVSVLA